MDTSGLYTQLQSAQESRAQLMRWKLVVIAGIGAPALGFTGIKANVSSHLALAVIQLACLYIDVMCRELSIRSKRVSTFLSNREHSDKFAKDFETFYRSTKRGFSLESFALIGSTVVSSILVGIIGFVLSSEWLYRVVFAISTASGLAGSFVIHILYGNRLKRIRSK